MSWDYGDRMRTYATQTGTSEPTVYAHFLYDAGGNRVKKVVRKSSGYPEVTVYIDGAFEYLYTYDSGGARDEEFNELHVMEGRSRIARVKVFGATWSGSTWDAEVYNLEDHLGNSAFSLDANSSLIYREEFFPFGESSFSEYGAKRYRFCGKERDEESGLYYYGARYYAPWTCRFVSIDPLAGEYPFYTPYQYAGNKPINYIDLDGLEEYDKSDWLGGAFHGWWTSKLSTAKGVFQTVNPIGRIWGQIEMVGSFAASIDSAAQGNPEPLMRSTVQQVVPGAGTALAVYDVGKAVKDDDYYKAFDIATYTYTSKIDEAKIAVATMGMAGSSGAKAGPAASVANAEAVASTEAAANAAITAELSPTTGSRAPTVPIQGPAMGSGFEIPGGQWQTVNESMSANSRAYQEYVTGHSSNLGYQINGVKFDGKRGSIPIDAKANFDNLVNKKTGQFYEFLKVNETLPAQAKRQLGATNGGALEWHFQSEITNKAVTALFEQKKITGVTMVNNPMQKGR